MSVRVTTSSGFPFVPLALLSGLGATLVWWIVFG
jgi:hypothetical protein